MKFTLHILAFCILPGILLSQKQTVHLITSNKQILSGEIVTLTVKSSIGGNVTIDFPEQFELGSGIMNGMEQEMDYNTGTVRSLYYFSQNGIFKKEGTYTFKAYVKNKNQVFKSNSITIQVKKQNQESEEIRNKQSKELAIGIIEKSKTTVYEGEALVLNAKVYYRPDLQIHNQFQYQTFELDKKAEIHEIGNSKGVYTSKETFKGQSFQTFTYGKQVVFPSTLGKQTVVPFEMVLQYNDGGLFLENLPFHSSRTSFEVIPLPKGAPLDFIAGVGEFECTSKINSTKIEAGNVLIYTLELSGKGNLQSIETPKLTLPKGLELYGDPERKDDYKISLEGFKGKINFIYRLKCTKSGSLEIPKTTISYFNPLEKKYITCSSDSHEITVSGTYNLHVKEATKIANNTENKIVKGEYSDKKEPSKSSNLTTFILISVFSPFALGFIFILILRKKKEHVNSKTVCSIYDSSTHKKQLEIQLIQVKNQFIELGLNEKITALNTLIKSILLYQLELENSDFSIREMIQVCKEKEIPILIVEEVRKKCEEASYSFEGEKIAFNSLEKLERIIGEF